MGKKYIIELPENTHWIQWIMEGTKDHHPYMGFKQVEDLTPYTEPDMEKVRGEAEQLGMVRAWEAARRIIHMPEGDLLNIFTECYSAVCTALQVFLKYDAAEAIEKLKAYEQEQEEAQVGDEVECDDERYVVLQKYLNSIDELMVVLFNRRNGEINKWHLYNADGVIFKKTGRHFPELVELLRKMKEEQP